MRKLTGKLVCVMWVASCLFVARAYCQEAQEESLGGPDSHETGQGPHGHLFGEWNGERTRLLERGVRFDFQYISDSLWNIKSEQKERLASWNRFWEPWTSILARWLVGRGYISMRQRSGRPEVISEHIWDF
ncbi:MAG TPA: hypothetical protein VK638_32485 [Edaphobacter sp.]|nr:hypothetical protein [Edaphobacter sp.]